jgi:hypothetical protein
VHQAAAAAGKVILFEDGYVEPGFCEAGGGCYAACSCACKGGVGLTVCLTGGEEMLTDDDGCQRLRLVVHDDLGWGFQRNGNAVLSKQIEFLEGDLSVPRSNRCDGEMFCGELCK